MTRRDDTQRKEDSILQSILQTVRSIEANTDDILDGLNDLLDAKQHVPAWPQDRDLKDKDYE